MTNSKNRNYGIHRSVLWVCLFFVVALTTQTVLAQSNFQNDAFNYPTNWTPVVGNQVMQAPVMNSVNSHQIGAGYYNQPQQHQSGTPMRYVAPYQSPELPSKYYRGVDQTSPLRRGTSNWHNAQMIPWETYAYGEYIGPARTPHIAEYRLRVEDRIEFVFQADRQRSANEYQLSVGDTIRVVSVVDERLNDSKILDGVTVLADGTISLDLIGNVVAAGKTIRNLQAELEQRYSRYFKTPPRINVSGISTDTARSDFLDSIDARSGSGGLARFATVTADGTLRLPLVGAIGVVGLTLDELEREVNARFSERIQGVQISVVLNEQAPRFLYVLGEVEQPGRIELEGPTSLMQAIALAGGWRNGGNLRQIVVFRRDKNWRLMALKLDLSGGLLGKKPLPVDEIWLRDSDIVLIPKSPILRLADAVELYFTRSLYSIFPSELGVFDAQSVNAF